MAGGPDAMNKPRRFTIPLISLLTVLLAAGLYCLATSVRAGRGPAPAAPELAATIMVNSTSSVSAANDGLCTLREAIVSANSHTPSGPAAGECPAGSLGTNTIVLPAGTYTLSDVGGSEFGEPNGLPTINSTITIQGAGAASTIIERSSAAGIDDFRIFYVKGVLTLKGVTVRNGRAVGLGAGINVQPSTGNTALTVVDCIFSNNINPGRHGGVIYSGAQETVINNSTFEGNQSGNGNSGGAIFSGN